MMERHAVRTGVLRGSAPVYLFVLVATLGVASGCGGPVKAPSVRATEIYTMGEKGSWADTMLMAKAYAQANADDPVAHYLLGKAYLHRAEPHLAQAEGEFKTARALISREGDAAAVAWERPESFTLALDRDLALVAFRWIREAMRFGVEPAQIRAKLLEAQHYVDAGLKADPKDSFLGEMKGTIETYLSGPYRQAPTPPPALAATEKST